MNTDVVQNLYKNSLVKKKKEGKAILLITHVSTLCASKLKFQYYSNYCENSDITVR